MFSAPGRGSGACDHATPISVVATSQASPPVLASQGGRKVVAMSQSEVWGSHTRAGRPRPRFCQTRANCLPALRIGLEGVAPLGDGRVTSRSVV